MGKRYHIDADQVVEMEAARAKNKNKNVENRLRALLLYAGGAKRREIAEKCEYAEAYVSELMGKYRDGGLAAVVKNHYSGNHRNMSFEEEAAVLKPFLEDMEAGKIVDTKEILAAYEKALGRTLENSRGQIYRVLARHGWRTVMPRSQHPEKASEEEIALAKNKILRAGTGL
jgi:transposase